MLSFFFVLSIAFGHIYIKSSDTEHSKFISRLEREVNKKIKSVINRFEGSTRTIYGHEILQIVRMEYGKILMLPRPIPSAHRLILDGVQLEKSSGALVDCTRDLVLQILPPRVVNTPPAAATNEATQTRVNIPPVEVDNEATPTGALSVSFMNYAPLGVLPLSELLESPSSDYVFLNDVNQQGFLFMRKTGGIVMVPPELVHDFVYQPMKFDVNSLPKHHEPHLLKIYEDAEKVFYDTLAYFFSGSVEPHFWRYKDGSIGTVPIHYDLSGHPYGIVNIPFYNPPCNVMVYLPYKTESRLPLNISENFLQAAHGEAQQAFLHDFMTAVLKETTPTTSKEEMETPFSG